MVRRWLKVGAEKLVNNRGPFHELRNSASPAVPVGTEASHTITMYIFTGE